MTDERSQALTDQDAIGALVNQRHGPRLVGAWRSLYRDN